MAALGAFEIADPRHLALDTDGHGGDRAPGSPRTDAAVRATAAASARHRSQSAATGGANPTAGRRGRRRSRRARDRPPLAPTMTANPFPETRAPGLAGKPPADAGIAPRQQRVGDDLLQPPATGDREQMRFALADGDFTSSPSSRRADSCSTGPAMRISSLLARRRITDGGACAIGASCALISASATRAPMSAIGAQLDGADQAIEHVVEQRDLLVVETAGGGQEQVGDAAGCFQAFPPSRSRIADSTSSMIDNSA